MNGNLANPGQQRGPSATNGAFAGTRSAGECRRFGCGSVALRFTPCRMVSALVENLSVVAGNAATGVAVLPSAAYSYSDMFPDGQDQGGISRFGCAHAIATGGGRDGVAAVGCLCATGCDRLSRGRRRALIALPRRFLRENAGANPPTSQLLNSRSARPRARIL